MEWFILAVLGVFTWALTNIVDKHFLSIKKIDPYAIVFLMGIFGMFVSPVIWLLKPIAFDLFWVLIAMLITVPRVIALLYYSKSVKSGEVSRAIAIMQSSPIFVAILAFVFLGESLTVFNYLGILVVIIGGVLLTIRGFKDLSIRRTTKYGLGCAILYAIFSVAIKYMTGVFDFWSLFFWTSFGFLFSSFLMLLKKSGRDGVKKFWGLRKRYKVVYAFNETLGAIGTFFLVAAMAAGPASLVAGVGATQPLFVLFFATLVTLFFPKLIKEDLAKKNIGMKLIGILLIIIGTVLIA